ncbi:cytochrome ubiquinol oxidase subunit I [Gallaecimonas mangrovi]|uniref:cytochrome ubiquinol oxidase subunit I n=1 Tax=Gallaecimonas mangrovi TaxID=2291597 RepID=UPI000E20188A|nr:cytochrome ubiquinol oxidase subunit I [Gallaecimonas mangrovi]
MGFFDALHLARLQFGFTVSFHIIFPAITIGLASFLAVLEGLWLWKKDPVYKDLYFFWSKIFAVNFAMGVVSGLVMAYQFGTNWSYFSTFAGSVTGPLLSYEVLTAFFLEAGFLGVQLFGWGRVSPRLHYFATLMVALGTLISATWILASNSWMQTPQGYDVVNGKVVPVDWFKIIFNPSFFYRLPHMVLAAYLSTALFVGATAAWHLLKGTANVAVKRMLSMAMWMLLCAIPVQVLVGDAHGLNTLEHQPAKLAAIEAHWQNQPGEAVPLVLFALPDNDGETNHFALEIPHLGSLILTHSFNGQIPALKDFPKADRPNVAVVFWTFRVMVALGLLMLALAVWGLWLRWRGRLYQNRLFLRVALWMGPSGLAALLAGWMTTEIGRQPWVVYGLMRTKDAVSNHAAAAMAGTLITIIVVYLLVFGTGIYYLLRLAAKGPQPAASTENSHPNHSPARPLSAVDESLYDEEKH